VTVLDIKQVFERVRWKTDSQEVEDLIHFFRIKKDENGRIMWKELIKAILEEDFTGTLK
jgi:hypothetical protein